MKTTIEKEMGATSGLTPDPHPQEIDKGGDIGSVNLDRVKASTENTNQVPKVGCPAEAFYP